MDDIYLKCPKCDNDIEISKNYTPGGVNDYGWWIIECDSCGEIFSFNLGRDINDSNLRKGGKVIKKCDREFYTEDEVAKKVEELKAEK
jgi:uncharacterized C2H2 Zn-finger protein